MRYTDVIVVWSLICSHFVYFAENGSYRFAITAEISFVKDTFVRLFLHYTVGHFCHSNTTVFYEAAATTEKL